MGCRSPGMGWDDGPEGKQGWEATGKMLPCLKSKSNPRGRPESSSPADEIQAEGNATRSSHHKYSINEDK